METYDPRRLQLRPGFSRLLDRPAAEQQMAERLGTASNFFLVELRHGEYLLSRIASTLPESFVRDTTAALLWQYLEQLDGMDVVWQAGALGPAEVVGRSVLEIGLQLIYLLEQGDERLAQAYSIDRIRRNLAGFAKLATGSAANRELIVEAKRSWMSSPGVWRQYPDTSETVEQLKSSLEEGPGGDVYRELERLGPNANWYSVFDGPRDLIELSRRIGMDQWHRMLYAPWSDRVHGRASNKVHVLDEEGRPFLNVLRWTEEWSIFLVISHLVTRRAFRGMVEKFVPEELEEFTQWESVGDQVVRKCLERNGVDPDKYARKDGGAGNAAT